MELKTPGVLHTLTELNVNSFAGVEVLGGLVGGVKGAGGACNVLSQAATLGFFFLVGPRTRRGWIRIPVNLFEGIPAEGQFHI